MFALFLFVATRRSTTRQSSAIPLASLPRHAASGCRRPRRA